MGPSWFGRPVWAAKEKQVVSLTFLICQILVACHFSLWWWIHIISWYAIQIHIYDSYIVPAPCFKGVPIKPKKTWWREAIQRSTHRTSRSTHTPPNLVVSSQGLKNRLWELLIDKPPKIKNWNGDLVFQKFVFCKCLQFWRSGFSWFLWDVQLEVWTNTYLNALLTSILEKLNWDWWLKSCTSLSHYLQYIHLQGSYVQVVQDFRYFSHQQDDIAKEWFQSSLMLLPQNEFVQRFQNWRTEDDDLMMFSFLPQDNSDWVLMRVDES